MIIGGGSWNNGSFGRNCTRSMGRDLFREELDIIAASEYGLCVTIYINLICQPTKVAIFAVYNYFER